MKVVSHPLAKIFQNFGVFRVWFIQVGSNNWVFLSVFLGRSKIELDCEPKFAVAIQEAKKSKEQKFKQQFNFGFLYV